MRIACLRVPDFPLQALRRTEPDLAEAVLAVASGPGPRDLLVAVSAEAAARGVRRGMTAAQARQVAPAVIVRVTPDEALAAAGEALADVAETVSPRVRRARPGEVLIDVGGSLRRHGGETNLARDLLRGCHRVGLDARVGIAGSCGVARIAARAGSGGDDPHATIVPPAGERAFLAPLPIALLEPAPVTVERLVCWGLHRTGELAALDRREVALRLGADGAAAHRLACGESDETFIPDPVRETLREGVHLDDPLVSLEAFLFVLRGLLTRLERRLELRGEGFAEVLLELRLDGGERREARVTLVAPVRDVAAVLALVRLRIEADPPGGAVEGLVALVTPGTVRLTQASLFGPRLPAPGKLAVTLARLGALLGPERVGAPAAPDTHRPGAWNVIPFTPVVAERAASVCEPPPGDDAPPPRVPVLRAFRPARDAEVVTAGERPVVLRVDGRGGVVVGFAGPYRYVGEWWRDEPFARDDFDVATADGFVWRVHFDRLARRWLADGLYD